MTCASDYAPHLHERGFRITSQRMAILHVLHHAGTHLSPTEVYKQAKHDLPGLTEPTVYRTLQFLARIGLVHPSHSPTGHSTYQIARDDHDHVVCRICRGETEVEHTLLEKLYREIETASGYRRFDSHVTFFGICPRCQSKTS